MKEEFFEFDCGNSLSFDEIGGILRELDIHIDDKALEGAKRNWNSIPKEARETMDQVALVLSYTGRGAYDDESGVFTPSSARIFCFDPELYDPDSMFEFFFAGIMSINGGEWVISDLWKETVSDADREKGIYQRNIKFKCNGHEYSYKAAIYYDWFDAGLIARVNEILSKEGFEKRLYSVANADMCELFYCTPAWAREFHRKTGSRLV